jgi:hypothetical protein
LQNDVDFRKLLRRLYEAADVAKFLTPEELSVPPDGMRGKRAVGWSQLCSLSLQLKLL